MSTTTDHPSPLCGASQCGRILAALQDRAGQWVSLIDLAQVSGSMAVHSRIADLRARGHQVEQKSERKGRMIHSSYRLVAFTGQGELF